MDSGRNYEKFDSMGLLSVDSVPLLDKRLMFEQQLGIINMRVRAILDFPPEHDCVHAEDAMEMVYVRLHELFDQVYHEVAKRFFYYLITSADLAAHMRHAFGIGIHGKALGNNTVVAINREKTNRVDYQSQIIIDAWRQYKLLSRIICSF